MIIKAAREENYDFPEVTVTIFIQEPAEKSDNSDDVTIPIAQFCLHQTEKREVRQVKLWGKKSSGAH